MRAASRGACQRMSISEILRREGTLGIRELLRARVSVCLIRISIPTFLPGRYPFAVAWGGGENGLFLQEYALRDTLPGRPMLSRKAKYALIAVLHLARHYGEGPLLIGEIAEAEGLPKKFLELILLELKNAGYLDSKKGKGGGYILARTPDAISVGAIVRTIDGPLAPFRCASQTAPLPCEECKSPETCGIRLVMKDARDAISGVLDNESLAQVIKRTDEIREQKQGSPMFYI